MSRETATFEGPEERLEGVAKVTGSARFTADLPSPDALQVCFLRSPHPHARIASIDTSAALQLPGVHGVLTGADVAPTRMGRHLQDWPVIAWDRVLFVGDRVAAVAAESRAQAEEALLAIEVEYVQLPAVFDIDEALAPTAPVLHPDLAEYRSMSSPPTGLGHPNLHGRIWHEHGDVDAAMVSAEHIFEHEFHLARTFTGYLEPRAAMVWIDDGTYHVATTNKAPFKLRRQMAHALDLTSDDLIIESSFIGGDFGGKGLTTEEYALLFMARLTGRPCRSVASYEDELTATSTRHGGTIWLRTGVDRDGRILAHEGRVRLNGGAYAAAKAAASLMPPKAAYTLAGYSVPAARVEAIAVYTNTVPAGHARSPGQPQNGFAAESHMDLIAQSLGIDPIELRMRNALRAGELDVGGKTWQTCAMPDVLMRLKAELEPLDRAGVRAPAARRGRGIALGLRPSASGGARISIRVTPRGTLEVGTGAPDQGGGAYTMLQRVVANTLDVPLDLVSVRHGTTSTSPEDEGVGGSRVTPIVGGAAQAAAVALRDALAVLFPRRPIREQIDLAAGAGGIDTVGEYRHSGADVATNAYAVDVEVDTETGQVTVLNCVLVADVGTVINPVAARGQLVGGFVSGLGQALMEELCIQEGVVTTAHLGDYKLPTMPDVPPIRIALTTDDKSAGPFGAKGIAELTNSAIAPAIGNAVADAVGARVFSLPITAEKVVAALDRKDSA